MNSIANKGNLPVIRAHYADILCQLAEERGVHRRDLLKASSIRPSLLGHPENLITVNQFSDLCREAIIRTNDPAISFDYGRRLKFTTHGSLSQAAISCDNLGDALALLIKYFQIRFAYMKMSCFTEGDEAVVQLDVLHDIKDLYQFNVEVIMASLMDVSDLLFGNRLLNGGSCRVTYPEPGHSTAYRALFGNAVTYSAEANQLRFRAEYLELPIALSNPVARRIAEEQCREELRSLPSELTTVESVGQVLDAVKDGRMPGIEEVAEQLNVSARTLRRQLGAEGAKFQSILDQKRHERAVSMLRQNRLSIDEIADRLGYSDPSNFGRAFRKWEGMSPSAWRAELNTRDSD